MAHDGVRFPAAYVPHRVPVVWRDGTPLLGVSAVAEEFATLYAGVLERMGARPPSATFRENFWADWSAMLPPGCPARNLGSCDFSRIRAHLAARRTEPPKKRKPALPPVTALVDGVPQPVIGATVEGAGIFVGRYENEPMAGRLKRRITSADVTLNLGPGARVPSPGDGGKAWAAVVRDPFVDWVASWRDPLNGVVKYARLGGALSSRVNREKFEQARKLGARMPELRAAVAKAMASPDAELRQLATCAWILDKTAMRCGGPTSTGLTTLERRHVSLGEASTAAVTFDFVGKDAVRYKKTVPVGRAARANVAACMSAKQPGDALFERVTAAKFNAFLGRLQPGLTAKVMRTCSASQAFQAALDADRRDPKTALVAAAARVAVLCNHRRGAVASASPEVPVLADDAADVKAYVKEHGLLLSTGLTNYVDPRIVDAFRARKGLPGASQEADATFRF
jgi:DNA topoisomerase-1